MLLAEIGQLDLLSKFVHERISWQNRLMFLVDRHGAVVAAQRVHTHIDIITTTIRERAIIIWCYFIEKSNSLRQKIEIGTDHTICIYLHVCILTVTNQQPLIDKRENQ